MGELAVEYLPVTDLEPDPRNAKRHDLDELDAAVEDLGWIDPLILDGRTGRLVAGHGRRALVLRRMADEEFREPPPGVRVDGDGTWLVPVVTGWESESDEQAEKALVALNRIVESGGWHDRALADSLERLKASTGLSGTGFAVGDLDAILKRVDPQSPEAFSEPNLDTNRACPKCGYEWSE